MGAPINMPQSSKPSFFSRLLSALFKAIILAAAVAVFVYFNLDSIRAAAAFVAAEYFPCRVPIYYSIGVLDKRFNVTKNEFETDIKKAINIWEKPIGKTLFAKAGNGGLKINLVYDTRQAATETLKNLGEAVDDTRSSYDSLKTRYESLHAVYENNRATFEAKATEFESRLNDYNAEVESWNARGGAPPEKFQTLKSEKSTLEAMTAELERLRQNINAEADDLNALALNLNNRAKALNLNVARYNEVGKQYGGEFEEGDYKSSGFSQEIDIYQFSSNDKLIRVLAHEFGHALGLDHVDDPKAIMYRLNQGENVSPSKSDVTALKAHCALK